MKRSTYCNPLPIPNFAPEQRGCSGFQALADPTVFEHEGRYYLYASDAQAWVSENLVDWEYHRVDLPAPMIGPAVEKHGGFFYLVGNGTKHLFRSTSPLGPWDDLGPMHDHTGKIAHWSDVYLFRDDDDRMYFYHHSGSGVGTDGIYVTELDPAANFTRALGPSTHCFGYDPSHVWERWGDANEFSDLAWIEGPWITKRKGVYYLQYSACGTEWESYAMGAYTSRSPTGPFTYMEASPFLKHRGGLIRGPGHHSVFAGPNGELWVLYHVLFGTTDKFDRRLALDPVGFDERGAMFVNGPTETPQWVPGKSETPSKENGAGRFPLTRLKPATASSHSPGRTPSYAVDHYVRTWWEAADTSRPQWLSVDLLGVFSISSVRVIFSTAGFSREDALAPFQYRLEVSDDGAAFRTALDMTKGEVARTVDYQEFPPVTCRYVRVTLSDGPKKPLGLIDFTVFGVRATAVGTAP